MPSWRHSAEARQCTFQTEKEWGSTTVGCTTSLPGNTPHVTAFTLDCPTLLRTCNPATVHERQPMPVVVLVQQAGHSPVGSRMLIGLLFGPVVKAGTCQTYLADRHTCNCSLLERVCVSPMACLNHACHTCLCAAVMLAATTAAYAAEVGRKLHPPAETKTEPFPNNAAAESKLLQGLSNTMYSLQANTLWSL